MSMPSSAALARRLSIASRPSNSNCPSRFLRAGRGFFFLPFCGAFLRLWRWGVFDYRANAARQLQRKETAIAGILRYTG